MRTTLLLSLLTGIFLTSCSLMQGKNDRDRYVVAKSGIRLREAPSTESRPEAVIPYLSRIMTSDKTGSPSTVDGITDYWYRTEWSKAQGWIFGGYTREKTADERIFYFYSHIPYDCSTIRHSPSFDISKAWGTKEEAAFSDFPILPSLIPGDDVLVVTAESVRTDRIRKMDINYSEVATYISFKTESGNTGDALCIGRAALEKRYGEQPVITPLRSLPGNDSERFVTDNLENIKIDFSLHSEDRASAVSKNYTVETFSLGGRNEYTVIVLKSRNREESYTDGLIVTRKGVILHSANGRIDCSFMLGGRPHLAVEEWIPYTGCCGMQVLKFEGDKAICVEEDHIFSN